MNDSSQTNSGPKTGIADYFASIFITGAARVILKTAFIIYAAILVAILLLAIGATLAALLALLAGIIGTPLAVIAGALVCAILLVGPLPGWVKSIVADLRNEMIPSPAVT